MVFENKNLLLKEFEYSITLRGLLKEENEVKNLNGETCFLIKTEDILKFYRKFDVYVKNAIGAVCESNVPCRAHAAHGYLNYLKEEIICNVEYDQHFYKAYYFRLAHSENVAFGGWTGKPVQPLCLKHLSYSRRLVYLN